MMFHKINCRFPWDQNTLIGWIMELIFNIVAATMYFIIASSFLILFFSICQYHGSFYKIFRLQIDEIDAAIAQQPLPTHRIKKLLYETINFHISAKK